MGKRVSALVLVLCLLLGCGASALALESEYKLYVDGVEVEYAYTELDDGVTYAAAFFVVQALYPDATAAWENESTVIRAEGLTITAKPGAKYLIANGRYLYVPTLVRSQEGTGNTMVPVRTLVKAMGAEMTYDAAGIYLTAGAGPILSGEEFYNAEDLDLIARVIRHEAGNQSLEGQMAVGNVILHRTQAKGFGGPTVKGVLFAPNQFTGATNCKASASSIIAAKLVMDGADVVPGAFWFNGVGRSFWASRNKALLYTIGGHAFYG